MVSHLALCTLQFRLCSYSAFVSVSSVLSVLRFPRLYHPFPYERYHDSPRRLARSGETATADRHQSQESGAGIDYELFLDCVHCGLCTAACPTYVELGNENDSPRGRIYLMRAVTDGRIPLGEQTKRHLELCLDCRACETACPSGVQYGKLIEPFRVAMEQATDGPKKTDDWFHRWILFGLFTRRDLMRTALWPARIAQNLGLHTLLKRTGLTKLIPGRLGQLVDMLPPLPKDEPQLPEFLPAIGPRRARVALFTGCVADAMFRSTHWATARVLQQNGCDVVIPRDQACCGRSIFMPVPASLPGSWPLRTCRR